MEHRAFTMQEFVRPKAITISVLPLPFQWFTRWCAIAVKGIIRSMKQEVEKLLYSRQEAAIAVGISRRSIDYYISRGEIRTVRIGSRVLIPASELRKFASKNHHGPIRQPRAAQKEAAA